MFERYLTDALTTHFGHFVENLDADKVRLSAWNGELVFKDLALKPNALDHLMPDCPVELAYGSVGNLELRIPWSLFRSQLKFGGAQKSSSRYISTTAPCSIILSDVNILITPRRRKDDDIEEDRREDSDQHSLETSTEERRTRKEGQVQSLLDGHLLRRVTESSGGGLGSSASSLSSSSSRWGWVRDWLSTLLSTLSVTVRNIHIRYEDPGTCMGLVWDGRKTAQYSSSSTVPRSIRSSSRQYRPSFAVGITLRQLSIQSDDDGVQSSSSSPAVSEEKEGEGKDELKTATSTLSPVSRPSEAFVSRKKIAAAERLAIYWDSGCNLMAIHSEILCQEGHVMENRAYFQSAFDVVNSTIAMSTTANPADTFEHRALYFHQHSYVLDPISPSINLNLISPNKDHTLRAPNSSTRLDSMDPLDDELDNSSNDGSTITNEPLHMESIPPSTLQVHLPPCKFTLDRSTLEDTAYVRKSLSVWRHAKTGLLSEATLRRLAELRPNKSPALDPRSWWFYVVEASLTLSQVNRDGKSIARDNSWDHLRRVRGWRSFWSAFQRRKRYVELCQCLVPSDIGVGNLSNDSDAESIHNKLLTMEDSLTPEEIVAFRLALYDSWKSTKTVTASSERHHVGPAPSTNKSWTIWTTKTREKSPKDLQYSGPILSLEHRVAMMHEMSLALEREKTNALKSAQADSIRQRAMQTIPTFAVDDDTGVPVALNPVVWKASVGCTEIAIQINDESLDTSTEESSRRTPVIRFSFAWLQDQRWFLDDSWDIDCSMASLVVKDLTVSKGSLSQRHFPNLVAAKSSRHGGKDGSTEFIWIEDQKHHKSLSICIQRRLHWSRGVDHELLRDFDRGSRTTNRIRVEPMEVVYSTVPVEVATRVLGTVKTPELVDDYHRMAAAAHGWQQRQKKKILAALAHKRKKIIVDVDVGAPEFLIPENINEPDSPMLAVDLGRLRLLNDVPSDGSPANYDDYWRFIISDIQVRSGNVAAFAQDMSLSQRSLEAVAYRQLVEPFSLNFAIATKIASEDNQEQEDQTKIRIGATLPRLAFNLNSSAIRLMSRLQSQFERRRKRRKTSSNMMANSMVSHQPPLGQAFLPTLTAGQKRYTADHSSTVEGESCRVIQFDFTAPLINLRLGSDTGDIQSASAPSPDEVALLDLAVHGIRGSLIQTVALGGESTSLFDAKLHSLSAIDLFQTAGKDFALLLSSSAKTGTDDDSFHDESPGRPPHAAWDWDGKDLVTIQYKSSSSVKVESAPIPNKLLIGFHELYVEWNPETFATIQKAIRVPSQEINLETVHTKDSAGDDEFFDAVEDSSLGLAEDDESFRLVSEVASSSFETAEGDSDGSGHTRRSSFSHSVMSLARSLSNVSAMSPSRRAYPSVAPLSPHTSTYPQFSDQMDAERDAKMVHNQPNLKGFELVFELSKLRVSFNKESRHRKVIIAQMDGTSVSYETRKDGGSVTKMKIGNLVFTDPSSARNATLYGEILGLKNKATTSVNISSLLEMEILIHPSTRSFVNGLNIEHDDPQHPVSIDRHNGILNGCNNFVTARFSPMRFVFLEQLWFEFIDYFFEGIIGTSVWSGRSSMSFVPAVVHLHRSTSSESRYMHGADAKGLNFTRFHIQLESPEVLLPVAYRSPHFLRLDLGGITIANKYNTSIIDDMDHDCKCRMQWFNNSSITLENLRLFSWTGRELGKSPVVTKITLRWPTGPSAALLTPKWNVNCHFETLQIALRRSDYALVQHIISKNIGEPSRHLDEWEALQTLSPNDFLAYSSAILVHFGYDKKDVTPTTYDLKISIPSFSVDFIIGDDDTTADTVAVARCINLSWILRKDSDLVVKQRAAFDVNLFAPSSTGTSDKLLSSWKYDQVSSTDSGTFNVDDETPELIYTSTTLPDGENVKTLEIVDASIYSNISQWRRFAGFFSGLPEPVLFDEQEIGSSIQVGDRWYKIGSAKPSTAESSVSHGSPGPFPWITTRTARTPRLLSQHEILKDIRKANVAPTFQLRISLKAPQIVLSSDAAEGPKSHVVLRMSHLDFLHVNSGADCKLTKSFFLDEVEVYTLSKSSQSTRKAAKGGGSLIHPWSVGGTIEQCNGKLGQDCKEHVTLISADILKARAAYSDIAIALEVCLSVANSERVHQNQRVSTQNTDSMKLSSPSSQSTTRHDEAEGFCCSPNETRFHADCEGFELLVADDSGRHFASNQDLITLSLGRILFSRKESRGKPSAMHLRVDSFDLYDDLQSDDSSFKTAATTRPEAVWTDIGGRAAIDTECQYLPRLYVWEDVEMKRDGDFRFMPSNVLLQRLVGVSSCCGLLERDTKSESCRAVRLSRLVDETKSQKYLVKLQSLSVQYNPSTVIAIQRFLGRLRKESKSKMTGIFESEVADSLEITKSDTVEEEIRAVSETETPKIPTVEAFVELGALTVCLNKEHQNRRLIELKLSSCQLRLHSSPHGMSLSGIVGSLAAWDPDTHASGILDGNRHLLRVIPSSRIPLDCDDQSFLKLEFRTFRGSDNSNKVGLLPAWVRRHIEKIGGIDDFLSLRVASTEFIFLKERTEELIDYLSNGLPGKGMGVTSRAAKGFISKRILTRSFLEFQNDSPQVFVPHHELSPHGISLKLGDVVVRSYFEQDTVYASSPTLEEWWRILSLQLSGFQFGVRRDEVFSEVTTPIDLGINLKRPTSKGGEVSIRGNLSLVDLSLDYSDYVLVRNVTKDNLGKKVDTDKWDNVEKAYESEDQIGDAVVLSLSADGESFGGVQVTDGRVAYSTNARFIRYGKAGKRKSKLERQDNLRTPGTVGRASTSDTKPPTTIDLKFTLDGLSLKLCRDDPLEALAADGDLVSQFRYDIILLRVQVVEVSLSSTDNGDLSLHLSLFRLGLFDMGDTGRRLREYYLSLSGGEGRRKPPRRPCPFCVIAEGYAPGSTSGGKSPSTAIQEDPQLVVTIEQRTASSAVATANTADLELPPNAKVTIARVVVNYLSLNMMLRPVKEALSFLSCEWPLDIDKANLSEDTRDFEGGRKSAPAHQLSDGVKSQALLLTLVAHYPRIFFLADECDNHSRALVLRGLAVVNLNKVARAEGGDLQHQLSSNAQLHSLESYINADVHNALSFKKDHLEIVGPQNADSFPDPSDGLEMESQGDASLGVALIQPVTAGLEFSEFRRDLYPTKRSVFVNVEPVSTMLSFEDLNLIETVAARLSSSRSKDKVQQNLDLVSSRRERSGPISPRATELTDHGASMYEVIFETQRLGLGLKTVEGRTIVNTIQNEEYEDIIHVGDAILSVAGSDCTGCTLDEIVKRLSRSGRPVTLQFSSSTSNLATRVGHKRTATLESDDIRGPEEEDLTENETFSVVSLVITMRKGMPNGLQLDRSICGALPVVSKVLPEIADAATHSTCGFANSTQIETRLGPQIRCPRAGAIVTAIDGLSLAEIGLEEAWKILSSMHEKSPEDLGARGSNANTYTLTFHEIDSKLWGTVERVNISSSGFTLSFIDDLHGRDMPLFRGRLDALELRAERGIGGRSQIIEVQVPSIIKVSNSESTDEGSGVVLTKKHLDQLRSERVVSVSAVATCSMDYFHPKVAFWEPLVESSQLFLLLEQQAGNPFAGRAGQVAIELSDQLLRDQDFRSGLLPAMGDTPKMVTFNLTDASAEVVVKASSQWKAWRMSKALVFDEDDAVEMEIEAGLKDRPAPLDHGTTSSLGSPASALKLHEDSEPFAGHLHNQQRSNVPRDAKRMAAQKAAQAALIFAKKRGAERSKKSDSAKPFVLRNRTGVSIAFVQQDPKLESGSCTTKAGSFPSISVVGEYQGLAAYNSSTIHELADTEDARFSMEVFSEHSEESTSRKATPSVRAALNKVRTYEGRFPSLTVAIQAVSGITVQPLRDLQVFKVGSTVRHLVVRKENQNDHAQAEEPMEYSIPVIWKVEIEDNRRVLTLSTAVRVVTTAFNAEMEIGMQPIVFDHSVEKCLISTTEMTAIGTVRQDSPFYLPLWVALKLEAVNVFVRPKRHGSINAKYGWGGSSILRFAPLDVDPRRGAMDGMKSWTWVWEETFEELDYIRCDSLDEKGRSLWLAVFSGSSPDGAVAGHYVGNPRRGASSTMKYYEEEHHEVISVTLDANITLRNMLPMRVDWQIAHIAYESSVPEIMDGSTSRAEAFGDGRPNPGALTAVLNSGECTEAFACDFQSTTLHARFREVGGRNWSDWASLSLDVLDDWEEATVDGEEESQAMFPRARQVNVQVTNDSFGVPMTFGVRILPKLTFGQMGDASRAQIYGVEIIVYTELWIRNITSLPLNFGCPSAQVHGSKASTSPAVAENASRFNAESALMEIASLLEVGDKGTGFDRQGGKGSVSEGGIESLPNQECDELWEEVFEYLEIEYSTVKRRWWASERYDSFRMNITQSAENGQWRWISENWSIDTAGDIDAGLGGWESIRGLLSSDGSFSPKRTFDSAHSIRRRRFFRNRSGHQGFGTGALAVNADTASAKNGLYEGGIHVIHHPLHDSFSREHNNIMRTKKQKQMGEGVLRNMAPFPGIDTPIQISAKCGDGKWSVPATISDAGNSHGVLRVLASRWPSLTSAHKSISREMSHNGGYPMASPFRYEPGNLSSKMYELCYSVVDAEGDWGEFSKIMTVSPRFMIRNESTRFTIEVKQAGTPDESSLKLVPGAFEAFYWEDFRLPGLLCVTPCVTDKNGLSLYKWSGGFDICNLGMIPLRIRQESRENVPEVSPAVKSMRALVEIRQGTGGFGINVSIREEDPFGDGALFRVENFSPFPIWLSQDGVLANPSKYLGQTSGVDSPQSQGDAGFLEAYEADGDMIRSNEKSVFALDVPYRQGKYAHRKEATLKELLRVRVALAPLVYRAGVETVKVAGVTNVGESLRLNPAKLVGVLDDKLRTQLQGMRVLAVVCSDGPTKVLRLSLIKVADQDLIGNTLREVSYMASKPNPPVEVAQSPRARHKKVSEEIQHAASTAASQFSEGNIPNEEQATRLALFASMERQLDGTSALDSNLSTNTGPSDTIYSVRVEFKGFLFSMVDSAPSEIAVATLRNFNALARWNEQRTDEASLILSIGWLQVDNHVPSAPFKVAIRPDASRQRLPDDDGDSDNDSEKDSSPLLMVAVAIAPKHKSEIVCVRSVTVAPRNLVIAVDLAFLVRLQRYAMGLKTHFRSRPMADGQNPTSNIAALSLYGEQKRNIPFPKFDAVEEELRKAAAFGAENQKLYFQGLTIMPAAITLSVAPARALTPAQATLEGNEVAAIHQAVRKGDVLVGSSSALLGVRVGRTNTTPLAVVRGVFKSIVVDALLRLDGASLQFSGVSLRNHISTGPQLGTYLAAHYLAALRQNVPALLGSLAAFGNPLGLIRGLGDGMSDFVSQPVRGLKKSVKELDPTYLVDGVARGTGSLARHAVGGFADSASLLTETFSKNMAVLTLDRRYAQKRDRNQQLRLNAGSTVTIAGGVESGFAKLVEGFMEGVTGVVKAPMRGAEKKGIEGFAKGIGKGLLGLLVKPMIGISDAATDVMIGVRNSVENAAGGQQQSLTLDRNQFRPRRPMYGRDKVLRPYAIEDAAAAALMLRTRCAGENYLSHLDLGDRVALLSVKRFILLGPKGQELMALKYKHVSKAEVRQIPTEDHNIGWAIIIVLNTPRKNGSEVEVLSCTSQQEAVELCAHIQRGVDLVASDHIGN